MTIGDHENARTAQLKSHQDFKVGKTNDCTPIRDVSENSICARAWLPRHARLGCWLRLESFARRRESSKPACRQRQRDRARRKALRRKLPDVSRPHRTRRRTWCSSIRKETGQFGSAHPGNRRKGWRVVLEDFGGASTNDYVEGESVGDTAVGACELYTHIRQMKILLPNNEHIPTVQILSKTLLALALALASTLALAGGSDWRAPAWAANRPNPVPVNAKTIALGKKIY